MSALSKSNSAVWIMTARKVLRSCRWGSHLSRLPYSRLSRLPHVFTSLSPPLLSHRTPLLGLSPLTLAMQLHEFVDYVENMSRWMRAELLLDHTQYSIFTLLASRAIEGPLLKRTQMSHPCNRAHLASHKTSRRLFPPLLTTLAFASPARSAYLPPTKVPEAKWIDDGSDQGPGNGLRRRCVASLETRRFGIQVEIPQMSVLNDEAGNGAKISVRTLAPSSVAYLSEASVRRGTGKLGEFSFSPVVRVDYPAFKDDNQVPELGGDRAKPFEQPLTLVIPHCFDPDDGKESCILLGAPHGATE